jgi:hypothetical protein
LLAVAQKKKKKEKKNMREKKRRNLPICLPRAQKDFNENVFIEQVLN